MKHYCPSCYKTIEYKIHKPKECPYCGEVFESVSISNILNKKNKISISKKRHEEEDAEEEYEVEDDFNIRNLKIKIEGAKANRGEKLGSLIGTGGVKLNREKKNYSSEEIVEIFRKEGGSSRKPIDIE